MKLNVKALRYMSKEEFRVLAAVEVGMKNHEIVPTALIINLANLKQGGTHRVISDLARNNLIARVQNSKYDGYRLTYGGLDYLALHAFVERESVVSVGQQIGVGKESDIVLVADKNGLQCVLKIQRLGRVSFRSVKNNRDYMQKNNKNASWMTLSRLAATKEYAFMKALHANGFPVPQPFDHNRHCVVMELIDGQILYQVGSVLHADQLYAQLMSLIVRLAQCGLIHGDFNEFNILLTADEQPVLIDFPQMVSTSHRNAEFYFDRDVNCIKTFFKRKFGYETDYYPTLSECMLMKKEVEIDVQLAASGFRKKDEQEFEALQNSQTQQELEVRNEADELAQQTEQLCVSQSSDCESSSCQEETVIIDSQSVRADVIREKVAKSLDQNRNKLPKLSSRNRTKKNMKPTTKDLM